MCWIPSIPPSLLPSFISFLPAFLLLPPCPFLLVPLPPFIPSSFPPFLIRSTFSLPCLLAFLCSCLLPDIFIILFPMSSSPKALPAWLSLPLMLSLWRDCCTETETRVTLECTRQWEKSERTGPLYSPFCIWHNNFSSFWIKGLIEKSYPCTSHPWNSHQWPPAASQHRIQPWLSSTRETWKSFKSILVLCLICHFPNTSHLYCSKQYISHQTVPNLSFLLLDSLHILSRAAACKVFPSLTNEQSDF